MIKVNLQHSYLKNLNEEIDNSKVMVINDFIRNRIGEGNEFLGWLDLPENYNRDEYMRMEKSASFLRNKIDILLVIGIGGSYLGTRAADEMINGLYSQNKVELIYVGNTMSATYTKQIQEYIKNKRFGICVISKSGTTTEPGIAFRIFEKQLITEVGVIHSQDLIVVITDKSKGALKVLSERKKYQTFIIPQDVGGRFSVLTPVGLYPLMVANIDCNSIMEGANQAFLDLKVKGLENPAYQYAVARYILHTKYEYKIEALVSYELQMQYFCEWWKQLFGESEGKKNKGIFPTSMLFSTDLHSLGQWVQEGPFNLLFETVLNFKDLKEDISIEKDSADLDGLNYLCNKTLNQVNQAAFKGVVNAHSGNGHIPNIILEISGGLNAKTFGYLVYFFELAVSMSGYLLKINPFNQPGVEIYKENMFSLLGKNEKKPKN